MDAEGFMAAIRRLQRADRTVFPLESDLVDPYDFERAECRRIADEADAEEALYDLLRD
jgi:hypothetical protein